MKFLRRIFFLCSFIVLTINHAKAAYMPAFYQYGRYNQFIYNPAFIGNNGSFCGSIYMSNPGILIGAELSSKEWKNSFGLVYDNVSNRYTFGLSHHYKIGKKVSLRLGLSGGYTYLNDQTDIFSPGIGALLQIEHFRAGASFNDIIQITNRIRPELSSVYSISYDFQTDKAIIAPHWGIYTDYGTTAINYITCQYKQGPLVAGGGVVTSGKDLSLLLNCGFRIKQSSLLLGVDGFPINGQPSIEKRFVSYHLMLRIQIN